jgi:hypothetical protein
MRTVLASVVCASAAMLTTGCTVHTYSRPVVVERRPVVVEERHVVQADVVEPETPVIVDAAPTEVLRIDVEPAPAERVYVYDEGYPPGCYLYGGFIYYGGYRYHRDIFVERVVRVNVREHRYVNVVENRRAGHVIEERHRTEFVKYGAHHASHPSVQRAVHETKTVTHTTHEPSKTVHETHVADGHNLGKYEEKKTVTEKKKVTKEEEHR